MEKRPKLVIETTFDFDGYLDYYRGHGHAFPPKNLAACIRFAVPITYRETVGDIIEQILEDINSCMEPFEVVNEKLFIKHEGLIRSITDEDLKASIRAELPEGTKDEDNFFDVEGEDAISDNELDELMELPLLIGYIHIYVEAALLNADAL